MARIYLNLEYMMFEPLTGVCNNSLHASVLERLTPLSVKPSEPAVFRSRVPTASRFKVRAEALISLWLLQSSFRGAITISFQREFSFIIVFAYFSPGFCHLSHIFGL